MPKLDVLSLKFFYNSEEYDFTSNPLLSKKKQNLKKSKRKEKT